MDRVEFLGFTFLTRDISRKDRYSTEQIKGGSPPFLAFPMQIVCKERLLLDFSPCRTLDGAVVAIHTCYQDPLL